MPLQPVHDVGTWIVDNKGRVVITHGLDVIWKTSPYYPTAFSAQDAKFLVSEGFSGARIGFIWAGVEPTPRALSSTYVSQIARINGILGQYGIRTLVDFHQDNYSAKYGGDGAPLWASQGSGTLQAFQNLWDNKSVDGTGLSQHFQAAWTAAARSLGKSTNLLGLDVFNEPYPGIQSGCSLFAPCPVFEEGQLADFYRGMITTIRKIDPNTLIFYEPIPELTGSNTSLPAPLTNDRNVGFTFHYYDRACGTLPDPVSPPGAAQQDLRCTPAESAALDAGIAYASRAGVAVDLGEFGDSTNATDDANMVDLADQRFLNWTYWEYYTTPSSLAPGLLIDDKKPGSEANTRQQILNALVVPYPEAVTGTPESYSLDRSTWTMTFTYSTTPVQKGLSCPNSPTEIFIPHRYYPHGYSVEVSGAKVVSPPTWPWVELVSHDHDTQVTVTVRSAADSSTQVPTSAIDPRPSTFDCR